MNLEKQVIVVTGGSSGLGEELARQFIRNGNEVWILSRTNCVVPFENFVSCDVTDSGQVKNAFETIFSKSGKIDVLVSNAGVGISGALELMELEEAKRVFDVNFWGVFNCFQAAAPYMKKGGKVFNISSACALFALPFRGMYCASKAAVNMFSFSAGMELADFGIKFCAICPGDIKTTFTKNRIKNFETSERYGESIRLSAEHIDSKQEKRMPVEYVAKKIVELTEKRRVRAMVIIGAKYKVLYFFKKILPISFFNFLTNKLFNKKR